MSHYMAAKEKQLTENHSRKQTHEYKTRWKAAKNTTVRTQHHYGLDSQQPDPPSEELERLRKEFYQREVEISLEDANYVKANTRKQSEDSLWHQQRRLRVTASNFVKIA
jgi:ribosomal protein S12 methylthiotransferase accessory factor YcaO